MVSMIASRLGFRRLGAAAAVAVCSAAVAWAPMAFAGSASSPSSIGGFGVALASPFSPLAASSSSPKTIAEFGEGAGEIEGPDGIAVDRSVGDVYVADGNNFRIDKFDEKGNFLLAWGWGVRDGLDSGLQTCGPQATPPSSQCFRGLNSANGSGAVGPSGLAVDQSSGDVYVSDNGQRRVSKFTSSGEFLFMVGANVDKTKVALEGGASQAEKNLCTAASGDTCGNGETGSGPGEFGPSIKTIVVGSTGIVWVGDEDRLTSFDSSGAAAATITLPGASYTQSLALDSADDFYVISAALPGVRELEADTGTPLKTLDAAGQARTVTLDEANNMYIGDSTTPYRFKVYDPAGKQTSEFGAGQVIGGPGTGNVYGGNEIAVGDSSGRLYAASGRSSESESVVQAFALPEPGPQVVSQGVENILPDSATLTAAINPESYETTYRFQYGTDESYGHSTIPQTLTADEFESEDVKAALDELIPGAIYHFRVVATNNCNSSEPAEVCTAQGEDRTFTTPPAVRIDAQWATDVTAHTAELHAEMDPLGVEAEAWLEYGTGEGYGQVVPLAGLDNGVGAVSSEAVLTGLQAGAAYHYRFVARDVRDAATYTVYGPDQTFTTQFGSVGFKLADDRAWEMVSPPNKHGGRLRGGGGAHLQAAAGGNGVAYQSYLSTEADPEGNRIPEASMNLARREANGSWRSKDITPPNDRVTSLGHGTDYKLFDSDLSEALLEPSSGTPLSPEASERTPYMRENAEPGVFTPLVTGKEPYANVPAATKFGGELLVVGVSRDFRHFALASGVPLVEGAPSSGLTLYEWTDGRLQPISVLPSGEIVAARYVGSGVGSVRGALSEDGSRVFWSGESSGNISALYVRDTVARESGQLDVVRSGADGRGTANPLFQGAAVDGSVVFFTDSQHLTEGASAKGSDLYRCQLPPGGIASGCATLTDISVAAEAGENGAEVVGVAAGLAENGSKIYFVARGVLDEAANEFGDGAVSGQPNLYVWQQGEGVRFIATLSGNDFADWGSQTPSLADGFAVYLAADSSPSGRYLAFMSQRDLTHYDNRDATSGEAAQEVFRYDSLTARLKCVSCDSTGARPHSAVPSQAFGALVDPQGQWRLPTAATLPEASAGVSVGAQPISFYRPRAALDNGRVFFNAIDSLVPADSNGEWDVYEYEPAGVGDCGGDSGGPSISRLGEDCVSLISSGTGETEAAFVDASVSGNDAFFFAPAQLNETDLDHEVDIYDARVDGLPATLPKITECLGEACQPLPAMPSDTTPASSTFEGTGNLPISKRGVKPRRLMRAQKLSRALSSCRKKHKRSKERRASCERHARKSFGASRSSRKANSSKKGGK